ncbi:CYTH domain-containing protein [Lacticaseibacillus sp. N501-2]|uniref:CYTH domain-containing protein n=1 Tax=Lacticaseibacillus salsurae TaxID=3367729 RepID=UPI0038B37C74
MSKELEQEFKTLLDAATAQKLRQQIAFQPPFTQTNRYFDTADHQLQAHHWGLRTRQFADYSEQTLKVPVGPDRKLMEYTDAITGNELVAGGTVATQLDAIGIDFNALHAFAQATTTRYLAPQAAGLLTLDHTTYLNGTSDWELEMEYTDAAIAKAFWAQLARDFDLTLLPPENKIQRAVENVKKSQA